MQVGEPFDVRSAEAQAAQEMQRRIGNHLSYADRVYRLLDLAISYDDEREIPVGSVDYVALLLMGRMANDMRAIGALARLGYGVQDCTLAASVLKVALTSVDVVTDDGRLLLTRRLRAGQITQVHGIHSSRPKRVATGLFVECRGLKRKNTRP